METTNYKTELSSRIINLIAECWDYNLKVLVEVEKDNLEKADLYKMVCEDIEEEIEVLMLIEDALYNNRPNIK